MCSREPPAARKRGNSVSSGSSSPLQISTSPASARLHPFDGMRLNVGAFGNGHDRGKIVLAPLPVWRRLTGSSRFLLSNDLLGDLFRGPLKRRKVSAQTVRRHCFNPLT